MSTSQPSQYRPVGIALAVGSGALIGCSFVFKKKGLLQSQAGGEAGEGVAYLKSWMWWIGMTMMIAGELCNFGAYAFVEAILVTPLGALSVVICAIMSHIFLKERLNLFGWIGCIQCILGSVIIALNGPEEQSVSTILEFKKLFLAPGFLSYGAVCIAIALSIIFYFGPRYGKKSMLWYIAVCSLIGGISVSCTQGLGACIVTSVRGDNQFKNWFTYFVLAFVAITLVTEIYYLNMALALFNTAMVTPTYYVLFTFCTLVTSIILYQGLKASAAQIITIVLAFLVICSGIFLLQMSRVEPSKLQHIDRKSTLLLQAAQQEVRPGDGDPEIGEILDEEKREIEATEDPGMDAIGGRFSGVSGSVVRARKRTIIRKSHSRSRRGSGFSAQTPPAGHSIDLPHVNHVLSSSGSPNRNGRPNSASSSVFLPSEVSFVTSTHHHPHPHPHLTGEEPSMHQLLSADRLVASPKASPSVDLSADQDPMANSDLTKSTITRFNMHEWPTSNRSSRKKKTSGTGTGTTTQTTTGSSSSLPPPLPQYTPANGHPAPAMPRPALVSNGNSHIPVLNLPTPSLHMSSRHPFGGPDVGSEGREASVTSTPVSALRSGSRPSILAQRPATAPNPNARRSPSPSPPPPIDAENTTSLEKSPLPPSDDKTE